MGRKSKADGGVYPCKLTPALARSIVDGVSDGLFDAQNAMRHGVDVTTLKSWVDRGLDEEAEDPFRGFAEAYLRASIELEQRTIKTILDAAQQWASCLDATEITALIGDADGCDSSDFDAPRGSYRKTRNEVRRMRGDWKAAAWFAERRWPLRWCPTRAPEGGPKDLLKLPDAVANRRLRVDEMTQNPPPELIKAFRAKGYDLVKLDKR